MREFKEGDIAYYYNGDKYLRCEIRGIDVTNTHYAAFFETGFPVKNSWRAIHKSEMFESPREISLKKLLDI